VKKVLLIVGGVLLVVGIGAWIFISLINDELKELVKTPIKEVELDNIADGTYTGSYSAFPVKVRVVVSVKHHVITDIIITHHDNGQGKPAEAIVEDVLAAQSLEVDAISGATYSSKVILLAIADALSP
jgi:uncharacterized protein with FMN-binding domain